MKFRLIEEKENKKTLDLDEALGLKEDYGSNYDFEDLFWWIYGDEDPLNLRVRFDKTADLIQDKYGDIIWSDPDAEGDLSNLPEEAKEEILDSARKEALSWRNLDIYNMGARYVDSLTLYKGLKKLLGIECDRLNESLKEDTIKQNGKWVNKGKEGTHGTFKTKKAADAQRKAMFANSGKNRDFGEALYSKNEIADFFDKAKRLGVENLSQLKDLLAQEESKGNTEKENIDAYADAVELGNDTLSNESLKEAFNDIKEVKRKLDLFPKQITVNKELKNDLIDLLKSKNISYMIDDHMTADGKIGNRLTFILKYPKNESLKEGLNKESLEQEIRKAIREHFKTWDDEDYEDMIGEYLVVEVEDQEDGRTKVEVRAELTYNTMDKIADELNKIVQKYDKDAYFDHEDSGIINAFIDKNAEGKVIDEYDASKDEKLQGVRLRDYRNKWSAIDHMEVNGVDYYMFENDTYGDETYYVVTPNINDGPFYETFDDIETCLRDEGVIKEDLNEVIDPLTAISAVSTVAGLVDQFTNKDGSLEENFEDSLDEKLIQGKSDATLKKNIATEVKAGKDPKQAYAIAKSIQKKNENLDEEIVDYFDNSVHDEDIVEDDFDEEHIEELAKKAIEESKKHTKEVGNTINENKPVATPTQEVINESINSNEEVVMDYVSPNAVDASFQAQAVDLDKI